VSSVAMPMGKVFTVLDVGQFVRYQVGRTLTWASFGITRDRAVATAKRLAKDEGLKLRDVVSAVQQEDGSWIVELAVKA
jgi:hypothetical protein